MIIGNTRDEARAMIHGAAEATRGHVQQLIGRHSIQTSTPSGRYQAVKPRALAIDRATGADDIRRLLATPDVVVGSVAAVTETGSLVVASGSGSQLPAYADGAARTIWIIGAQKSYPI